MDDIDVIDLESDWLPAAELRRLADEVRTQYPAASVEMADPAHRGLDPSIVVAAISGLTAIAVPFVTALAGRIFAKEPEASVVLVESDGQRQIVLRSTIPAQESARLIEEALTAGARRVQISLDPSAQ